MTGVVPDTIEPYVGWRSWETRDGLLYSPQQNTPWPAGKALKATCNAPRCSWTEWRWELADADDPETWVGSTPVLLRAENGFHRLAPPAETPPPGAAWKLTAATVTEKADHEPPGDCCQCGIYASAEPNGTMMISEFPDNIVVGKVALWGRTTLGTKGARAEYAYPLALWAYPSLADALADRYQVPVHTDVVWSGTAWTKVTGLSSALHEVRVKIAAGEPVRPARRTRRLFRRSRQ